jgi:hypothetical protein
VPAFTWSPNIPWPSYTGYAQLPDSIKKTIDVFIPLSGISGTDSVMVALDDGSNLSGHTYLSMRVGASASGVTLPTAKISNLNNTTTGTLSVTVLKFAQIGFGGKNFVFLNEVVFRKQVEIDNY